MNNIITSLFEPKCSHRHTAKTHPNCFNADGTLKEKIEVVEEEDSRILVLDIETLPIVAYVWQVWDENVNMDRIIKDWCVLSWSAKWLGDDRIMSDVLTSKEAKNRDDKRLVSSIYKLIDTANIVIAHNGKRFDIKKLNTRFWRHKLPRPSSYKVIDTLSVAKKEFSLTFNKQDFIAQFLEIQEKLDTNFQLWADCDDGNSEALKYMMEYNEQDVRMLEEIYMEMRGWISNHPDLRPYLIDKDVCPICGGKEYNEIGIFVAKSLRYVEYRCDSCKNIWHDSKAIKE